MTEAELRVSVPGGPGGGVSQSDVAIRDIGKCTFPSPVSRHLGDEAMVFVGAADKVLVNDQLSQLPRDPETLAALPAFELAGPRNRIFFDPTKARAGIVTCGGLCPGLNNVIRGLVMELTRHYGVSRITGFRNGYQGFIARYKHPVVDLDAELVRNINEDGGTLLGSSRGQQDPDEIVDCLEQLGVNIVFVILMLNGLSLSFGHGAGFTVGLFFLSLIFYYILAFDSSRYQGPGGSGFAPVGYATA